MTGFSPVLVAGFFNGAAYPFSVFAGDTPIFAYCKAIHPPNYHHNSRKPLIPAALSSNVHPS
jgi:hypothetical protein